MKFDYKKYPILNLINNPIDLRKLSKKKLFFLSKELRSFLIESVSYSGGHFSSGLGVIELTIALHYMYNTPFDNIIWDIGHQSYPHKIITGRKNNIFSIRKKNGLHPFPSIYESIYDSFSVGHSSTSISIGIGMSVASKYEGMKRRTVCVIGDGAITSGMAFEALNHQGNIKSNLLIILNDNGMSISKNVGALSNYFKKYCLYKNNYIFNNIYYKYNINNNINNLFKQLGFNYVGPIDGHNILNLIKYIKKMEKIKSPKILHIITKKGYGYLKAEKNSTKWHSVSKFNIKTGKFISNKNSIYTYSYIFGEWICNIANYDKKLLVITPAMSEGSSIVKFSKKYPDQYFDVSIAEQHSITFAAGLSIMGYNPVVSIYSSFLQRGYDQIIHDVAIQSLPILFAIDRSGIVGSDGETHQGIFDISFLRCIPNIIIMTPSNENELSLMLHTGYNYKKGPTVVRYPRGNCYGKLLNNLYNLPIGKGLIYKIGKKIAILNFGILLPHVIYAAKFFNATVVDMRFVKPFDKILINNLIINHTIIVTVEENVIIGGAGSGINEYIMFNKFNVSILNIGIPDYFIPHGTQKEIRKFLGLDGEGIRKKIYEWIN